MQEVADINIRTLQLDELDKMWCLRQQALIDANPDAGYTEHDASAASLEKDADQSTVHVGAFIGGVLVGGLRLVMLDDKARARAQVSGGGYDVERVVVDRDLQGQHIGQRLMAYAEDEARRLGAQVLVLSSMPKQEIAVFYQTCGYVPTGHNQEWKGVNYPIMTKDLANAESE